MRKKHRRILARLSLRASFTCMGYFIYTDMDGGKGGEYVGKDLLLVVLLDGIQSRLSVGKGHKAAT